MLKKLPLFLKYGFRPGKPKLIGRLVTDYWRALVLKKIPLRYADIALDYKCNLTCRHCFASSLINSRQPKLTLAEYQRLAEELLRLGVLHFSFQGGEVFLNPDFLYEVIRLFRPRESLISVTTNATLLGKKEIAELKKLKVDMLNISLDSMLEDEHDSFRGREGVFKKVIEAINNAEAAGINVAINTVASKDNIYTEGFKGLIEWSKEAKILLNIILASPSGRWKGNYEIMAGDSEIAELSRYSRQSAYVRRDVDANFLTYGCPAAKEACYITPYGDILPCPFIHISLGNVRDEPVRNILHRGASLDFFKTYSPKCLACEDRDFIEKYIVPTFKEEELPLPYSAFCQ